MSEHSLNEFLILNVDDTDAARYAKSKILSRAGFRVIEATSGNDALLAAKEQLPDLILLDTKMPDINGFEVCRRLKSDPVTQSIAILQTSASFLTTLDKVTAIDGGADNYLFEPIEPEELIVNIKALIRLSLAEHEVREINRRKDVFLATLAHELRNPLGPIRNAVKLLENKDAYSSDKQLELLGIISRQTNQMVRLVDDLLDVSRISQGKISLQIEDVNIREFIDAAVESSSNMIKERGHQLDLRISTEGLYIQGDRVRLVQIVSNLLNNAAKFTPRGGLITLEVSKQQHQLIIAITDNGIGLSQLNLETIFELFVQHGHLEDRVQEGLGIGLALVKNLTELHGGEISVDSPGLHQGSTFTLKFSLADASAFNPVSMATEQTQTQEVEISKILVIDDNVDAANTLADLLRLLGHEVETAFSGKQGIERAKTFLPKVVFLDIGLPDILGYEVAKLLRLEEATKNAYLIALTGYGTESDQQLALRSGFDQHLTKPLDYAKIQAIKLGL